MGKLNKKIGCVNRCPSSQLKNVTKKHATSGPGVCNSRINNNHNCNTDRRCGDTFKKDLSECAFTKQIKEVLQAKESLKHVSCSFGNWASHILQQWESMGTAFLLNLRRRGVIAACPTRGSGSHGLLLRVFATASRIS
jgi:hypothetical protein